MASEQEPHLYESFEKEKPQKREKNKIAQRWLVTVVVTVILSGTVCFFVGFAIGHFAVPRKGMSYIRIYVAINFATLINILLVCNGKKSICHWLVVAAE